jgi:hypothetical protein
VTKKNKALAILIGSAMFTSAARFSYSYLRFNEIAGKISLVKEGDTRRQVIELLGKPGDQNHPCQNDIRTAPKGCAREFVYGLPLPTRWMPDHVVVSFSKDDRVIEAHRYVSP